MGHQVTYYLLPDDLRALELRIKAKAPALLLRDRSRSNVPEVVDSIGELEGGKPFLFYAWTMPGDLKNIHMEEVRAQAYWVVDELRSPLIQFNCCGFDGETLGRGRLYYVDGFWGDDQTWIAKPEPFRRWAKSVLTVAKKTLIQRGLDYIGPAANKWLNERGGRLDL